MINVLKRKRPPKRLRVVAGVTCWCKAFNRRAACYCVRFNDSEQDGSK